MSKFSLSPIIEKFVMQTYTDTEKIPTHKQIVRWMEKNHPDSVDKYMSSHRAGLLSGAVTRTLAAQRNHLKNSQLAIRLMDGSMDSVFDTDKLWATTFFVPGDTWKSLGELTSDDHEAIAEKYGVLATASIARADMHRDLAKRIGGGTTADLQPRHVVKAINRAYNTQPALTGGK